MTLRRATLAWLLGLGILGAPAMAQNDATTKDKPAEKEASAEEKDPFAVPEGTDATVLSLFLQRIARTPPAERTPEAISEHLQKMDKAVAEVLGREIDAELVSNAASLRLQVLTLLERFGDQTAVAKREKFVDSLRTDKRPEIQAIAKKVDLESKVSQFPNLSQEERMKVANELVAELGTIPEGDDNALQTTVQMANQVAQLLDRLGETKAAASIYNQMVTKLKARDDERLTGTIESLEGTMRRLSLLGNEIDIEGTTVEGKPFNIDSYKGKVVLVDFWATWCGPCVAELPNVKAMYDAYHDKGFEVVGISLDESKEDLVGFIEKRDLKWVTLFSENPENQGWNNPIARHYGISGIPTVILVNQEGKVVHLNARGNVLQEELAKLLGPLPETKESASE
ncbi:MAG: TlpA family protein disulfide reductase [Planctomycetaceae bacterium]|nr:TlpA family protein disulfide reductase [Planctomycetaceae bacterium]